ERWLVRGHQARAAPLLPAVAAGQNSAHRGGLSSCSALIGAEEELIGRTVGLVAVGGAQRVQMLREPRALLWRHLDAGQDPAVVRAVITIVKQADIPPHSNGL